MTMKTHRTVFFVLPLDRIRREQRQIVVSRRWNLVYGAVLLLLLSALLGWVLSLMKAVPVMQGLKVPGLAMIPVNAQEVVICLVLLAIAGGAWMAARKIKRDDDEVLRLAAEEAAGAASDEDAEAEEDVFASLRESPPRVPTSVELVNIVGACLSELRSAQLRVRVAQGTLDITAYDDSLAMVQRELDAVCRCLSELKARHEGQKEVLP